MDEGLFLYPSLPGHISSFTVKTLSPFIRLCLGATEVELRLRHKDYLFPSVWLTTMLYSGA